MAKIQSNWKYVIAFEQAYRLRVAPETGMECAHLPATPFRLELALVFDGEICHRRRKVGSKWSPVDTISKQGGLDMVNAIA